MNQQTIFLLCRLCQIRYGLGIDFSSWPGFVFSPVYSRISRTVDNRIHFMYLDKLFDRRIIGNINSATSVKNTSSKGEKPIFLNSEPNCPLAPVINIFAINYKLNVHFPVPAATTETHTPATTETFTTIKKSPNFSILRSPQPTPQKQTPPPISYAFCPLPRESFLLQEFSIDPQRRIIELNPTLILRSIIIVTFILKNRLWTQHSEPMCKSFRNKKKLSFIFTRQDYGHMFSKSSRIFP